jgi:tetratricopeptide (TPR) repeat protein
MRCLSHPSRHHALARRLRAAACLAACLAYAAACATACSNTPTEVQHPTAPADTPKTPPPTVTYQETRADTRAEVDAAIALATSGQTDAAILRLRATLNADPNAFLAAYNLAVLLDQQQRPQEAAPLYERALSIEPDFSPALLNLARLHARTGRDPLPTIDRAITLRPDNIGHKLTRLDALLATNRPNDVIDDARAVLRLDEANARARYYLAAAHYDLKRFPLAQFIIQGALDIDPSDPEAFFLSGLIHTALNDLTTAEQHFKRATTLRPDFPEAQNALGLSLYRVRDFDGAEAAFSAALKFEPSLHEAYLNLGNTLKALSRGDDAERAYLQALSLRPQWADAHFALGALYLAIDAVPLSAFGSTSDDKLTRLERARAKIQEAQQLWANDPPNQKLAADFIAKVDRNVEAVNESKFFEDSGSWGDDSGGDSWDDPAPTSPPADDWGDDAPAPAPSPAPAPTPAPSPTPAPIDDGWDDDK